MFLIGQLIAPENLHINESVDSSNVASVIEWTPPYSAVSNQTIHVDPHITHYTVYITDSYTGDVVKANVTDNHFTFNNQGNVLCPMYQVSAWNSGGEGKLSEPVQESTPRGKQAKDILYLPATSFYTVAIRYAS